MRDTDNEEAAMETVARAVAEAMPPKEIWPNGQAWILKSRDEEPAFGRPEDADQRICRVVDGLEIVLARWKDHRGSREKRITVRGIWPRDKNNQVHTVRGETYEITVGAKYKAEYIAKEIARRFLPRWEVALEAARTECNQYDDFEKRKLETADGLARILGEENREGTIRLYWGAGELYGSFVCGSSVRIELTTSPLAAKMIAEMIAAWRASHSPAREIADLQGAFLSGGVDA